MFGGARFFGACFSAKVRVVVEAISYTVLAKTGLLDSIDCLVPIYPT